MIWICIFASDMCFVVFHIFMYVENSSSIGQHSTSGRFHFKSLKNVKPDNGNAKYYVHYHLDGFYKKSYSYVCDTLTHLATEGTVIVFFFWKCCHQSVHLAPEISFELSYCTHRVLKFIATFIRNVSRHWVNTTYFNKDLVSFRAPVGRQTR